MNLVHAASIQKQAGQALVGTPPVANGTPRTHAANGHAAPVAGQGPSDADRSGLVTSSLPEPLSDQQACRETSLCHDWKFRPPQCLSTVVQICSLCVYLCGADLYYLGRILHVSILCAWVKYLVPAQQAGTSGTGWPALGAASWAAKAVTPAAVPAPQPPPLPAEDSKQDWPELPGAVVDSPEATRAGSMAPVAPVAAQLQRKGSTMAAELARAASAPNGAAAAAKAPAPRQPAANAVLVVPKKKSAAAVRTPKKATAAPAPALAAEGQESSAAEVPLSTSTALANGDAAEPGSPVTAAGKTAEAASSSKSGKKQGDAAAARGDSQEPSKQPRVQVRSDSSFIVLFFSRYN